MAEIPLLGFGYNEDQKKVLSLLKDANSSKRKTKLCLMAAPSFVVDFGYEKFVPQMKALGFDKVSELTFGAKIVNQNYHKYIKEHYSKYIQSGKLEKNDNNFGSEKLAMKGKDFQGTKPAKKNKYFQEKFISSVCPSCVEMVKNSFPELKKFLMPFDSPMGAMAKILKKNFPEHKIVFLSPCSAKKLEASKLVDKNGKKLIEGAITFAEMRQIIAKEKPVAKNVSHKFDAFYNDYTKIYPLAGGLCGSLHYENILKKEHVVSCDGVKDLEELLKKHSDKVLLDILFCRGGCIGGPGVRNPLPLFLKKQRVLSYVKVAAREKMDGNEGLDKYSKGIDFGKKF